MNPVKPPGLATASSGEGVLKIKTEKLELAGAQKAEYDFQGDVTKMLDAAKKRSRGAPSGMKIDDIGFEASLLDPATLVDPASKLLGEAREQVRAHEYDEALATLARLLELTRAHHEGIYLTAYCYAHRDTEDEDDARRALEALLPLRNAAMESDLAVRVETLRDALRARRSLHVLLGYLQRKPKPAELIRFLREETELDPGNGLPHFLLTGELLTSGSFVEAIAAGERGLASCTEPDDVRRLNGVLGAVRSRAAEKAMQVAVTLYREGAMARALGALEKVEAAHRKAPLYVAFEAYVRQLSGGATGFFGGLFTKSRTPASLRPAGSSRTIDELGFLITRADLDFLKGMMEGGKSDLATAASAERRSAAAADLAPWFPYIQFVYGQCIYVHLCERLESGKSGSLAETAATLRRSKERLKMAAVDPEIKGAKGAIETVDQLLAHCTEVSRLDVVNKEFRGIMEFVGEGVKSPAHYREIKSKLEALKARLRTLRGELKGDQAKEALDGLAGVVQKSLDQINAMQGDVELSETVEKHFKKFHAKIESLKSSPISTQFELLLAKAFFSELRGEVQSDRRKASSPQAVAALDALLAQIDQVVGMLNRGG